MGEDKDRGVCIELAETGAHSKVYLDGEDITQGLRLTDISITVSGSDTTRAVLTLLPSKVIARPGAVEVERPGDEEARRIVEAMDG